MHKLRRALLGAGVLLVVLIGGTRFAAMAAPSSRPPVAGEHEESREDDRDDTAITGDALATASRAALAHTGGGRVTDTEVGDEDSFYEVEVRRHDGSQVDVQLDRAFNVVGAEREGRRG